MLKRKKFVIQWRKFGLKRSCIFWVMNLWVYALFSDFNSIFKLIFSYLKSQKRGFLTRRWWRGELTWHAGPARGTTARMRRDTEATWQGRRWPTRGPGGAQGADTWQEATSVHGSTRTPVWGATWQERVSIWRAHGLVGPGKMIGAVTQ